MNKQAGFTLIELVVVIVILGLLAAAALPRFVNVTQDARVSSLNGVAGGLRTAASLARAEYIVTGDNTATDVTMDGQPVTVLSETANAGRGGRPTGDAAGISEAMPDPDGYSVTYAGGVATYQPDSGGGATCQVQYTAAALGDPVVVTDTGC
ncbi:MAG: type II secretion system protein [Thioalkalispiraceae bacterium]